MTTTPTIAPVLNSEDLSALIAERTDVRLLDVRTPGEFESAHIHGAYNVPLDTLSEHAGEIRSAVTSPVVLICRSGQRARQAEAVLRTAGMPQLHVLDGGLNSWQATGHPVTRGPERLSLERQVRIVAGALAAAGGLLALTVNRRFGLIPTAIGSGLAFSGLTDTCGMAMLLAKLPYNQPANCDVDAMVRALKDGVAPDTGRSNGRAAQCCR